MKKYSVTIKRHRTSISLEEPFYQALTDIASEQQRTLAALIADIDSRERQGGLSSAIRIYVLQFYRERARRFSGPC